MQPSAAPDYKTILLAHGEVLKHSVDALRDAPEHWHKVVLIELATEDLLNCLELVKGETEGNIARCAWAARNLVELHYFTRYIIASPENAERFHEDMACDYQDLLKRFSKHLQHTQVTTAGQAIVDHIWTHAQQASKEDTFLTARKIAEDFGEGVRFGDANKFLSKFVHPTSMSIQLRKVQEFTALILPAIVETSTVIVANTFPLLAAHIEEHSVRARAANPS